MQPELELEPSVRVCSKSSCKIQLPPASQYKWKTCEKHRQDSRARWQSHQPQPANPRQPLAEIQANQLSVKRPRFAGENEDGNTSGSGGSEMENCRKKRARDIPTVDPRTLFESVKLAFKRDENVNFVGSCDMPLDVNIGHLQRVKLVAEEIWKITGYRWTVKDHTRLTDGYSSRYHCSQDVDKKKMAKKSKGLQPGAKPRDNLGMDRFICGSFLQISVSNCPSLQKQIIHIQIRHQKRHVLYYDVALPEEVQTIIRENIWSIPSAIALKIQKTHPNLTSQQIYRAWTKFTEVLWRRKDDQLESAREILEEMKISNEIDVFDLEMAPDVIALAWGLKKVAKQLDGQIIEIALDATYNTNSRNLELYGCLGEYDNSGFPLAYCLLTTASSITSGKRKITITSFLENLKKAYNLNPRFVHTDKDIAEIKSAQAVWPSSKHQLCWWHVKRAITTRLKKAKRGTTPYDPLVAKEEFNFIDLNFVPLAEAALSDVEDAEDIIGARDEANIEKRSADSAANMAELQASPNPTFLSAPSSELVPRSLAGPNALLVKLKIPEGFKPIVSSMESDAEDDVDANGEVNSFCPSIYRSRIIQMLEQHFCAHPLIPGYSAPSRNGIRAWAVKEMYSFCEKYNLRSCWAYLWGNWYRKERWALWARAECDEIPRLKTTMICESHWRRLKHDFLHHFHKPRIDLLAWIIMNQLAPTYYRKLNGLQTYSGRNRWQASWRKCFKSDWKKCEKKTIPHPDDPKYAPNPRLWICTCRQFVKSRFLICKHLVQLVHPVPPSFFLEANRNRTAPFWSHSALRPLKDEFSASTHISTPNITPASDGENGNDSSTNGEDNESTSSDDCDQVVCTTYDEEIDSLIAKFRGMAERLEYQRSFRDSRFLHDFKKQIAKFIQYFNNLEDYERRLNSVRTARPAMWNEAAGMMFYRAPPPKDTCR